MVLSKSDLLAEADLHRAIGYIEEQLRRELAIAVHVHAVSSVPAASAVLDRFFERELLPRFEEAQSLREASVARKIGALRNSVIAALETMIDQEGRAHSHRVPADLEKRLRLITGEMGELGVTLDHAFLAYGESADTVVQEAAGRAVTWIRGHPGQALTALQLSEWIHDAVQSFLNQQADKLRAAMEGAVSTLREAASDLDSSETPSAEDFENLLRDLPRFELAALPAEVRPGRWKWMGDGVLRRATANSLRRSIGPALRSELRLYGRALRQWSEQAIRRATVFVNSYADAYRAQIHRMQGLGEGQKDMAKIREDLEQLREWSEDSGAAVKRV